MSRYMTYELDEFRPWADLSIYVYGNAEISYRWDGRDRETGDWPGPADIELHYLEINDHKTDAKHVIDKTNPLFTAIEHALQTHSSVYDACRDDYEEI